MKLTKWQRLQNLAKRMFPGAILTRESGRIHHDGDARNADFIVECKQRTQPNFVLTRRVIKKLKGEAFSRGLTPVWMIENAFGEQVVIMLVEDFRRMVKEDK